MPVKRVRNTRVSFTCRSVQVISSALNSVVVQIKRALLPSFAIEEIYDERVRFISFFLVLRTLFGVFVPAVMHTVESAEGDVALATLPLVLDSGNHFLGFPGEIVLGGVGKHARSRCSREKMMGDIPFHT